MPTNTIAASENDIIQREELILGKEPRIPPPGPEEMGAEALEFTKRLRKAASGNPDNVAEADVPEMIITLLRHPELFTAVSGVSIQLLGKGKLTARDRELAILRTAWLWQAPYEWGEHVKLAKLAGISANEIECVKIGSSDPTWDCYESALLRTAEELIGGGMVSDETWAELARRLDYQQQFELMVVVGQFTAVAFFQNALRFRLAPGNAGLQER